MAGINEKEIYDVVVIGGGPAGLTAALYLARARCRVVVVEKENFGGQITITSEVVNYPGVEKTSGAALTETMRKQAESFGAEFILSEVTSLKLEGDIKEVKTGRGTLLCFGIVLATGAHPRKVGFKGEEEFRGHGVAYCATCDGEFFTGKEVFVIGGGFAAAEESVFLTRYAKHVTVLIRGEDFKCAKSTAEAARRHEKISVLTNTSVLEVSGDFMLQKIRCQNTKTNEVSEYSAPDGEDIGVFVFAGYEPATELIQGTITLNEQGYIETDRAQKTNIDGVYAAGDICIKNLRQVVTAVGDGAVAATELEHYVTFLREKTGIHPVSRIESEDTKHTQEAPSDAKGPGGGIFSEDVEKQLLGVFAKLEKPLVLKLFLDSRPVSEELRAYIEEMASLTNKISVEIEEASEEEETPCVRVFLQNGADTGLAFHGVPGGHEFTSFVLGLYNAAGPGQEIDEETKRQIEAIDYPVDMRIMVSLSCTMCPELVMAAQKIASVNPMVRAEIYDLNHFPEKKDKYRVMSVPCMTVNEEQIVFGKKNISQLLEIIRK